MWTLKDILNFRKIYGLRLLYASEKVLVITIPIWTYLISKLHSFVNTETHTRLAKWFSACCYTVAHSYLTMTHRLQHSKLPCPLPSPRACSKSCLLSQWCHLTVSSSVICFFSHFQSFPASGFFLLSQHFSSGSQSIGASASASILPMNIQDWIPLELRSLTTLQYNDSLESSPHHSSKTSILSVQASLWSNSHIHAWLLEKP